MDIQNYRAIDNNGNIIDFPFKDWQEQSDDGANYVFQVISDTDNIAVYRMIDLIGDNDGYTGQWWKVDATSNVISTGNDCAIKGRSVNYNDKVINCTGSLCEYQILPHCSSFVQSRSATSGKHSACTRLHRKPTQYKEINHVKSNSIKHRVKRYVNPVYCDYILGAL